MAAASQIGSRFGCLDNVDLQSLGDFVAFWGGAEEESHAQEVDSCSSSPTSSSYERPSDDSGAHELMAPSTAKRSQKKPPKFSSTYRRQQHMKRILHEHAREYEAKLRELERARAVRAESLIIHGDTPREDQFVLLEKWKAIAKDQSEQLARARYENSKLWLRVVEEKKLARRLHQMLVGRASSNAVSFVAGVLVYHSSSRDMCQIGSTMLVNRTGAADLSMSDRSVFTELVSSLSGMISSARSKFDVLEHNAPRSGSYRSWRLCVDANQRSVVEVVDCEELPYRKEQVDAALQRLTGSSAAGCRELSAEVVTIRWSGSFACLLRVAESHDIPSGVYAALRWICGCGGRRARKDIGRARWLPLPPSFPNLRGRRAHSGVFIRTHRARR